MDGTDAGNVEDELVVIMSFCEGDTAGVVGSFARYFSIEVPTRAELSWRCLLCVYSCLKHFLKWLNNLSQWPTKSVVGLTFVRPKETFYNPHWINISLQSSLVPRPLAADEENLAGNEAI